MFIDTYMLVDVDLDVDIDVYSHVHVLLYVCVKLRIHISNYEGNTSIYTNGLQIMVQKIHICACVCIITKNPLCSRLGTASYSVQFK